MNSIDFKKLSRIYLDLFKKHKADIHVHLILNRKSSIKNTTQAEQVELYARGLSDEKSADLITRFENCELLLTVYEGDIDFISSLLNKKQQKRCKFEFVYQAGVSGTGPGHRTLIPAFCAHYDIHVMNSDATSRAIVWHKLFHGQQLELNNINVPMTYLYDVKNGWYMNKRPPIGLKVIAKSTYEAFAVGVDSQSIFHYSKDSENLLKAKSKKLGQPLTIQEFISGEEVYIPIIDLGKPIALPPQQLSINNKLVKDNEILTFEDNLNRKYSFKTYMNEDQDFINSLKRKAVAAFNCILQSGISRVDFRITDKKEAFIIDQAEVPSLSRAHAFNCAFKSIGGNERDLIPLLIASNLKRML